MIHVLVRVHQAGCLLRIERREVNPSPTAFDLSREPHPSRSTFASPLNKGLIQSLSDAACRACQHGLRPAESPLYVIEGASAATDVDLISYQRSIPDARMRRGVRFPAIPGCWCPAGLSGCQILRDQERFASAIGLLFPPFSPTGGRGSPLRCSRS